MAKMYRKIIFLVLTAISLSACAYNIENGQAKNINSVEQTVAQVEVSNFDIGIENIESLNQEAMVLGIICSAHKYKMNLGTDLAQNLAALDKDGSLDSSAKPDVQVVASSSNSTLKCIAASAVSGKCQAKVDVSGKIVSKSGDTKPFNISKTSVMPTTMCEGATKSLRTASSEVVSEVIKKVRDYDK